MPARPLSACRLYTFVDTAYLNGREPAVIARELCLGGADVIQLRAKNLPGDQVLSMARSVLEVTRPSRVPLIINDHPDVARSTEAEGCHLGQEDFFDRGLTDTARLRGKPGPSIIGLSTHAPEQAVRALDTHPDYIAIGPVYATPTKPSASPVTLDYVRWAAQNVPIPWFAIGGIHPHNLEEVLEAGATRICVVSGILGAPDIAEACHQFKSRLPSPAS